MYQTVLSLYYRFTSFLLAAYTDAPYTWAPTEAPMDAAYRSSRAGINAGLLTGMMVPLLIAAVFVLAIIPARIARRKGYSFPLFYWFGVAAFIPALIVANCIHDRSARTNTAAVQTSAAPAAPVQPATPAETIKAQVSTAQEEVRPNAAPADAGASITEELKKLKELLDANVISEEEFQEAKSKLLAKL